MIASLLAVDQWLFVLLNQQVANPLFDWIFPFITQPQPWLIAAAAGSGWLLWKYRSVGIQFVLMSALAIGATDAFNSRVLKPWFERQRPCHSMTAVRLLVRCGSGYAFPSSHAANAFCAAGLLAWGLRRWQWGWWGMAALIGFSRIYCGVHYPADVLAGAVEGVLFARGWLCITRRFFPCVVLPNSQCWKNSGAVDARQTS